MNRNVLLSMLLLLPLPILAGDWDSLQTLSPSDRIRVYTVDDHPTTGTFVQWSAEGLTVQTKSARAVQIGRSQIREVTVLHKGGRGKRALIGLAAGFGAGFAFGAAAPPTRDIPRAGAGTMLGLTFGGVGAGIGALVPGDREVTVYKKPKHE